jgi:mono/diheme cytochrome c family protein
MKRNDLNISKLVKNLSGAFFIGLLGLSLHSCTSDPNSPGVEYMPDMYRSPALEPNMQQVDEYSKDSAEVRLPAEGTIPRGFMPFGIPESNEGYELAASLKNPLPYSDEALEEGKVIFGKMCSHCHGKNGKGDGGVPGNSDYPPPPAYDGLLKDLPAGKIFYSITYGKNMMGSHASQISQEDRWKLVFYVQKLQGHDVKALYSPSETPVDSAVVAVGNAG